MSSIDQPVKKYRLLKELPFCNAGAIFTLRQENGKYIYRDKHNDVWEYPETVVAFAKEWFSPIEEELPLTKENISISDVFLNAPDKYNRNVYSFRTSSLLLQEKLPVIKQAIKNALNDCPPQPAEQVLNSNNEGDGSGIIRVAEAHWKEIHKLLDKYEKEMGTMIEEKVYAGMENVFNAARDRADSWWNEQIKNWTYPTFKDYQNKIPKPENKSLPTDTVKDEIKKNDWVIAYGVDIEVLFCNDDTVFFVNGTKAPRKECIKIDAPKDKVDGKEGRDWEILSVLADDGNPIYYPSRDIIDACLKRNGERIHSVKRNSDQITFTVGDIIEGAQLEAHNTVSHHPTEIKSIRVINGTIGLAYGNGGEVIISHAKKLPESQPKEQVPLFTTEDGVKVMEWDTFYYVPESMEWVNSCCRAMPQPPESFKYFSTKEAAEQYILENKPCLSLNDVKLISNIHGVTEKTQWYEVPLYALKHTIKQIINQ